MSTEFDIGRFIFLLLRHPQVPDGHSGLLSKDFFSFTRSADKCPTYVNSRHITGRHDLEDGKYCIIPTTFQAKKEGDFLLRIYTETATKSR